MSEWKRERANKRASERVSVQAIIAAMRWFRPNHHQLRKLCWKQKRRFESLKRNLKSCSERDLRNKARGKMDAESVNKRKRGRMWYRKMNFKDQNTNCHYEDYCHHASRKKNEGEDAVWAQERRFRLKKDPASQRISHVRSKARVKFKGKRRIRVKDVELGSEMEKPRFQEKNKG